jgi:hypothetical protein
LISKQGKTARIDVEKILSDKLPGWRVKMNLERYINQGYLEQDERGTLFMGWRSRAEIDRKKLVDLVVGFGRKVKSE